MRSFARLILALIFLATNVVVAHAAPPEPGFTALFDGKSLDGWDGNPEFWRVEDGVITGQTTHEKPTKGNTFLIWRKGKVADFELRVEFRIVGGNSGIQYRSEEVDKWVIKGYQGDFDAAGQWTGSLYEEKGRGVLAKRGNKVTVRGKKDIENQGVTTPEADLLGSIKAGGWNEYTIIAQGNRIIHKLNGLLSVDVTDDDEAGRKSDGLLALQLHAGPPMLVQFRNIRIRTPDTTSAARPRGQFNLADGKRVVFIAGKKSHGYAQHEHNAGCDLLARELRRAEPNWNVSVHHNGWPTEANALDGADAIVMYCDGGKNHMVTPNLDQVDALAKKGVGIGCIHYAVEIPAGREGNALLDWIGGYFEANWSVNPHWTAKFEKFPDHPVARGVQPFAINDEWYYHMRFRPEMQGVTPILTALPGPDTLTRPDGPHSGNPTVREEVAKGIPQHVMWVATRDNDGRGFGFTGGHNHWNWGDPNFRKVVLNAIVWIAHGQVPANGVELKSVTLEDLEANQDEKPLPKNFDREAIRKQLNLPAASDAPAKQSNTAPAKVLHRSEIVSTRTPGLSVQIDAPLAGARELYLVVTDGGNSFSCDWADWGEPRLVGPRGELKLTELQWKKANCQWGSVNKNLNCNGGPLMINNQLVPYGIGTHATSVIAFDLPEGYDRFVARAGLDNGGSNQGAAAQVQFVVFDGPPPADLLKTYADTASHDPGDAIAGIDIAAGVEATLFAAEPMVRNLTNMDIDARGRVWVCEVMNYRKHNGERPEGDRVLILDDTDHDGRADKSTVFYQGTDINSAMGICVLGKKVIVTCSPNVWVFTDENGDDVPDRKEALFTNVGQPQHDHSGHTFLFGPDGRYYWNFGNTGQKVCDAQGNIVKDIFGNEVVDNGEPYWGGMAFRCNPDGSRFEVLGHNFRNNYELTVDSFGTVWQSDNDDDGNRGVRINYVMEYGNYGYRDQVTGAGWKVPRENMEAEIPQQHWHLNDPGVVPNLLITGGGSPTGICVYEGRLLPQVFWDQLIHCDAGPNVVRAYPAKPDGAGYQAEIVDLMVGTRDRWFRPADVCVAPDGSVFVTDWYDPGVGGHGQADTDRGRVFRLAPPKHKYEAPKVDVSTAEGSIEALKSPALSVRYLGFTALEKLGAKAEPALDKMFREEQNPRLRARALWVSAAIAGSEKRLADLAGMAADDGNIDLRITGIRLLRQRMKDASGLATFVMRKDASPAVRRELALALHGSTDELALKLWADLAKQHDGKDRWYLEALGIGADGNWDVCLDAWLKAVDNQWNTPAGRDIVWRSRAKQTPALLTAILKDASTSEADQPRYFRALDMLSGPEKDKALHELLIVDGTAANAASPATDARVVRALLRVGDVDLSERSDLKQVVSRYLAQKPDVEVALKLIERCNVREARDSVAEILTGQTDDTLRVRAAQLLLRWNESGLLTGLMGDKDETKAAGVIRAVGLAGSGKTNVLFEPLLADPPRGASVRTAAVEALGRNKPGQQWLLTWITKTPPANELKFALANALLGSKDDTIRTEAAKHLQLPPSADKEPLPPVSTLVRRTGNSGAGKVVFMAVGTCAKCHKVLGEGKEVGPDLSEIGSKLSREAMYVSILDPSAAISHNFEQFSLILENGTVANGILVSETPNEVVIKTAEAIVQTIPRKEIAEMEKSKLSLMPSDLQKNLTQQNLVDLVEYLMSLKKK
ncbi:MAG: DUF1080 domain-containing protein [Planctomycetes bacterium]|nr:DUF1080 domain-containing protein [Planctomycetota bacterium]